MSLDISRNHFELFGLPVAYGIDIQALEQAFRDAQAEVHPDRYAHAGDAEKRVSMQWATHVNEAYQTLKKPFERARYLLELQGVHAMDPSNTAMPADFLLQQMEWREQLSEAREQADTKALDALDREMRAVTRQLESELAAELDQRHDYAAAAGSLRKYRFMEKLLHEIDEAYDHLG